MNLFSVIIGIGASIGLLRVLQKTGSGSHLRWLAAALISLAGGLIGSRIGFVVAYQQYFATHVNEIHRIDLGGLSWPGALAGAILCSWIALRLLRLSVLEGADRLSRMLMPLSASVWLAGWQAGIAYGQLLPAGTWWGMMIRDEYGLAALRVPVQPAAVLTLLALLIACEWLTRNNKRAGFKAACCGIVLSIHSLLFSLMRYDSVQTLFGLRLDSWAAIIFVLLSILFLVLLNAPKKPKNEEQDGEQV